MSSRQPSETTGSLRTTAQQWWLRLLPLTLLIILGLAGLRGTVGTPRWDGPLHRDVLGVGVTLEVVFGTLLVITLWRYRTGSQEPAATKLRGVLAFALAAGMVAAAVFTLVGLHLHLFSGHQGRPRFPARPRVTPSISRLPRPGANQGVDIPVTTVLYILLIVALLAALVLSLWWARRLRPSIGPREGGFIAEDPEDLREAVESGRSALRTVDDARAAIIACYVAMENSMAERGAVRGVADTPDELLARATQNGVVRGTAAARLTALFYEARFSSHPLDRGQRDEAERTLDELASALGATSGAPQ